MLNIFVNTWGNYNVNGADGGEWITLPMDPEELKKELSSISNAMQDFDPEYCIHDFEWTTEFDLREIGENENIDELNEWIQELANMDEYDQKEIAAIMEATGYSFEDALEGKEAGSYIFYPGMDLLEVVEELVNDCYFTKDTPDILTRYFDYEAFARDLGFDGYTETSYSSSKFGILQWLRPVSTL